MDWRPALWSGIGAVGLVVAGAGAWIASLPPAPASVAAPQIAQAEGDATLAALKPRGRQRPLIAIIGINDATETTDYLMPYGILRRADVADVVALATGPGQWDVRHDSQAFRFTRPFALTAIGNTLAFWNREEFGMRLTPGVDEVSLALVADAWSRTYRSRAQTFANSADALETRSGIRILPDQAAADWPAGRLLAPTGDMPPAKALDETLRAIAARYGARTADFVAMQLEYPRSGASP
ncbi:MAG: hypothetical protein E5Y31_13735 [Mesorhizobium sp.]|nr:MAG: hypothetical protein E5Y31_13735 [Mesorhizobium sp.]